MNSALQVADALLYFSNRTYGITLTNLALNKLIYYAQGRHLVKTGNTLFDEPILAWRYGPVIQSVYYSFRAYEDHGIPAPDALDCGLSSEELDSVIEVLLTFADCQFDGKMLRDITHAPNTPWSRLYVEGQNVPISNELLKAYFASNEPFVTIKDVLSRIPRAETKRTANGVWELQIEYD